MEFDLNDKNDWRIVNCSTRALDYPRDAEMAPNRKGVYLLLNGNNGVVCVGIASNNTIKNEIQTNSAIDNDREEVTAYRWFITVNGEKAERVGTDLIRKYLT
jgi:hypothetical protein